MTRFGPSALHAARRALSQLILGGVFERFPGLKVVLVELRADWIPATLAHLDARVAESSLGLPLKPSEYFAAQRLGRAELAAARRGSMSPRDLDQEVHLRLHPRPAPGGHAARHR